MLKCAINCAVKIWNRFQNSFFGEKTNLYIGFETDGQSPLKVLFLSKCMKFWKLLSSSWFHNPANSSFFSSFLNFIACNRSIKLVFLVSFISEFWAEIWKWEWIGRYIKFLFCFQNHFIFSFLLFSIPPCWGYSLFFLWHFPKSLFPSSFRSIEVLQWTCTQTDWGWTTDTHRQWERSFTENTGSVKSLRTSQYWYGSCSCPFYPHTNPYCLTCQWSFQLTQLKVGLKFGLGIHLNQSFIAKTDVHNDTHDLTSSSPLFTPYVRRRNRTFYSSPGRKNQTAEATATQKLAEHAARTPGCLGSLQHGSAYPAGTQRVGCSL